MKIAVVGSREFKDKQFVYNKVAVCGIKGDTFISGGAKGVDTWAKESIGFQNDELLVAGLETFNFIEFLPDWKQHGISAGAIRNQKIVDAADKVIAFWDGKSKGTKITIDMAIAKGIPVDIYIRK